MVQIETERVLLRQFTMKDLDDFYEYAKSDKIGPMAGWKPHKNKFETRLILRNFINNKNVWTIYHKKDKKSIGSIGIHEDEKRDLKVQEGMAIGYVLAEEYWGQGLVVEAVKKIIDYCFNNLKLKILSVYHFDFNFQSKRVIEKLNFKFEGVIRMGSKDYSGKIYDTYSYSMTKDEYFKINKKKR